MSEPRKHHYVPICYQRGFANPRGLLWVYDRRLRTEKELHPKSICFNKDLYALKPADGPKDMRIESMALATVDGLFATALRDLVPGKVPAVSTFEAIAYFVGVQYSRLPSYANLISAVYKKGAEEFMRLSAVNVDRMKSILEKYSRATGEKVDVTPESMVDAVRGNHLEVVVNERPFLHHLFKQAEDLGNVIAKLSWEILVAGPESGFILCDDPVVIVPPRGVKDVGFLVPGSAKYLPLTRRFCLRLGNIGNSFAYRNVDRRAVRIINYNIAAHSERFIMGPAREQLANVVLSSGSIAPEPTPRFSLETPEETDSGSLQQITQNPRRYFYLEGATQSP